MKMDNPLGKKSASEVEESLHRLRRQENSFAFDFFFLFREYGERMNGFVWRFASAQAV